MKNVVIIMAGGSGTRLWPLSKKNIPKQFLNLTDSKNTMIQLTCNRIKTLVPAEDIYIVTTSSYKDLVYEQLSEIPKENIVVQPLNRNTAPCIALASKLIEKKYGDANVIVLASDHNIKNNKLLLDCIKGGIKKLTEDNIVTIGIVPNRIETGYGYIKLGEKLDDSNIYSVEKFVEKPNFDKAKEYYESGNYLWNSGMFIWKNSCILNYLKKYALGIYDGAGKAVKKFDTKDYEKVLYQEYEKMESISIDYAVMEKVSNILVVPGNFGWDDVGSWLALERLSNLDEDNNIFKGNIVSYDSKDNIIINESNERLVTTLGLNNMVVVETKDATLIINKDQVTDISKLLKKIEENDYEEYL